MKLVIFGASGLLGTRLVTEALNRGHEVTAAAGDAARLDDHGGTVRTASADATRAGSVARVAGGNEVAIAILHETEQPKHPRQRITAAY
jgi:putative NADH-flavin reductase